METRESIWSVSRRFRIIYSTVFTALFCAGCVLAVIESGHLRDTRYWDWHSYLNSLILKIGGYSLAAAAAGVVITDFVEVAVMLSELLAERIARKRQEREERLREEGRREGIQHERDRLRRAGIEVPPDPAENGSSQ